jgi:hypothetical protein
LDFDAFVKIRAMQFCERLFVEVPAVSAQLRVRAVAPFIAGLDAVHESVAGSPKHTEFNEQQKPIEMDDVQSRVQEEEDDAAEELSDDIRRRQPG